MSASEPMAPVLAAVGKAIWWMLLIRGIVAILFGILAIAMPTEITLVALAYLFAGYSIVNGALEISHALRVRGRARGWTWLLGAGILSVLVGILAAVFPALTSFAGLLVIVYLIAFWSILNGVAGFPAAHAISDGGRRVGAYVFAGLAVVFGLALLSAATFNSPGAVQALVWTVGVYAVIAGIVLVVLAVGVRSTARRMLAG